jgi:predicted nucleotidyltransferase
MIETKLVQKFGNSGHVVLPKECIGRRIKFVTEPKTFQDIKSEITDILKPYLENIVGVYLYGSYARNEQTADSDVDILVITTTKFKIIEKMDNYNIISTTINDIENTLRNNAVLILPIIKEIRTIINPDLLKKYQNYRFTKKNTKQFLDSTKRILVLNEKGLELDFEIGSLVYSLMLRIRGLLIIKLMENDNLYSKSSLFNYLGDSNLSKDKINELYRVHNSEKNDIKVIGSDIITKTDIGRLLVVAEKLLKSINGLFK